MPRVAALLCLLLTACVDETISGWSDPSTIWHLEKIDGRAVDFPATIAFPSEGVARGEGPCNAFRARQTEVYPWFGIDGLTATRRACPALAEERAFFEALGSMTLAEATARVLILSDGAGGAMVFRATR